MKKLDSLTAYQLVEQRKIEEIDALGSVLEHKKTGARIFLLENDDNNKVFSIGFRTPPSDHTGLPHILEHSVLCGSKKFPVKDPFVELVKGSLNTFINAMTYPDKTVYPVASCNDKDFQNLMDVYLDAVLNPNIYQEEKIFMQEGWHYELESEQAPLVYNGVVYNEMKGAFSSPDSVLERHIQKALFPDTCYSFESGGDPEYIPNLTYQQFLDFHKTYYHPSNSYIYLYGDMDMAEKLEWLDQQYLGNYEKKEISSEIKMQAPFERPVEEQIYYSITEEEEAENATYLSVSHVVGTDLDRKLYVAFQILDYTLISAPGAPLKQALLDAGIGQDILGGYDNGILQPYFSVIAKGAQDEQKGEFLAVIEGTLRKLIDDGIDQKSLLAGLNYFEFRYREADYGSYPKGLMYGLQCLDSWLYDGDPMLHLAYQETFQFLKEQVNQGYFEKLIQEYLLDNPFKAILMLSPEKNLNAKLEGKLAQQLAEFKAGLSSEQCQNLMNETRLLKEYQDTPSDKELLKKIPLLQRSDIGKKAEELIWAEKLIGGVQVLHHDLFTSGIGYLNVLFNTNRVATEDLPYVGLLKVVLGSVNTQNYSYRDLTSEIYLNSGGVGFSVTSYADLNKHNHFTGAFVANVKVMYDKLDFGFSILSEILTRSILDDEKRLSEILGETKSRSRRRLDSASHSAAAARATSYFSASSAYSDITGGIGFYQFLEDVVKNYESNKTQLIAKLKEVMEKLFTIDNMLVSYVADDKGFALLEESMKKLTDDLPKGSGKIYSYQFATGNRNEGFKTSSQVNYLARCGNFIDAGCEYTGVLKILKVILSYDYLWLNIRVKGGAYGCMSGFGRSGEGYFVSYRDPNLAETNAVYERVIDYLKEFDVDDRDMTKYVIGAVSDMDTPLTPSLKGLKALSGYLSGITQEMMQTERNQVLSATPLDIRNLVKIVKAVLDTGSICAIGNDEKIEADKILFKEVKNLYRG